MGLINGENAITQKENFLKRHEEDRKEWKNGETPRLSRLLSKQKAFSIVTNKVKKISKGIMAPNTLEDNEEFPFVFFTKASNIKGTNPFFANGDQAVSIFLGVYRDKKTREYKPRYRIEVDYGRIE